MPLVADMSSCILSRPTDVSKYGLIYFGVQKNVAPAGMAVVIVREDLLGHAAPQVPTMLNYKTIIDADSMYNTPALLVHLYDGAGAGISRGRGRRSGRDGAAQQRKGRAAL